MNTEVYKQIVVYESWCPQSNKVIVMVSLVRLSCFLWVRNDLTNNFSIGGQKVLKRASL